ncbi:MAG: amino acid adenylation domain-containing protein [Acidobacteriota bacterium]
MVNGFRLSPKQEHLWSLAQTHSEMPYVAQCVIMIEGPLNRSALKEGLLKVVEQHEILRTNFKYWPELNIPVQTISETRIAWADPCDLRRLPASDQELELQRLIETSRQSPFDLQQGAVFHAQLVQLWFWGHQLILTLPALCADCSTMTSLFERIKDYYHNDVQVEESHEQPLQYADVSQWFYETLGTEDAQMGREYWRNQQVSGAGSITLPFEKRSANEKVFRPRVFRVRVCDTLDRKIKRFIHEQEVSLAAFFLSCWQILLWGLTRQSPLQIGLACNSHNYPGLERTFGLLTAHVPLLSEVHADSSARDIFQATAAAIDEAWQWQDYFTWSGSNGFANASSVSFFPICFEFIDQLAESAGGGTKFLMQQQYVCFDRFKVKLACVASDHRLVSEFHYDSELFDSESIQCLASRFHALVGSVLAEPGGPAETWEILGETERQTLAAYNETAEVFEDLRSFQEAFELQVERSPDAPALCCGDEQLSYAELNAAANDVAHHLISRGIRPEDRVALCLERSPLMVISVLGVLKAGAAYLPLDVQAPARRLQLILEDAQVSAVITQSQFLELFPTEAEFHVWCLDTKLFSVNVHHKGNPPAIAHPKNLAYVIYTSGSTGNPKGVMIDHRGLINYLSWARRSYRIGEGSRTLVHSPFSFDLTITGLLPPLIAGGTVELVKQGDELEHLCDALANSEQHYSLIKLTPSHLQVLSSWLGERKRGGRVDALIIGGEALSGDLLTVWQQQSAETRLINEYGPTETVVGCGTYEVPAATCKGSIPIGRPISNMQMYVLDEEMRQLPAGVVGEIYIGGEGVARGYLGETALTAQRFVPDPFSPEPGKRLYRSGDLGRMRADGEMEYLGRTDEQVKIKGFRIELGEVESVLLQHAVVKESAVILQETAEGKRLLGYVVLGEENGNGRELRKRAKEEIKAYLERELPEYMVPKDIIVLERMRLTPNGKIDRKALPLPATEFREEDENYLEQLSPAGKILARIWCEFLNLERVEVNDNFFALGGDSILAVQIAFKAKQLGLTFHPVQLFRHPTIAQLESAIGAPPAESRLGIF